MEEKNKKENIFEKYKKDAKEGKTKFNEFSNTDAFKERINRLQNAIYDRLIKKGK